MRTYLADAVSYIEENGDELERARLAGILGRPRPEPRVARVLVGRQNDDGGFPYGMIPERPSSVAATSAVMQWMHDLRLVPSSYVERAAAFLLTVQRPEGAWEESPAILKFDPPTLVRPGTPLGRTYCTAMAAGWMVRLLGARHDAVMRATTFLRTQRDGGWPAGEPPPVIALITTVLLMADGAASPGVAAGLAALNALTPDAWTGERLADALLALYPAGLPASHALVAAGLERLRALQRPEGGWSSEHGPDRDVDVSLRALSVLTAYGVSTRVQADRAPGQDQKA
jgi:hypothetical protein